MLGKQEALRWPLPAPHLSFQKPPNRNQLGRELENVLCKCQSREGQEGKLRQGSHAHMAAWLSHIQARLGAWPVVAHKGDGPGPGPLLTMRSWLRWLPAGESGKDLP